MPTIQTITAPVFQLPDSGSSRLMLKFNGYHAFTEPQLKACVLWAARAMSAYIDQHGARCSGAPNTYFPPSEQADPEVIKAFEQAFDFLCYLGKAGHAGPSTIWISGEVLL